jgi:hypothetical protein
VICRGCNCREKPQLREQMMRSLQILVASPCISLISLSIPLRTGILIFKGFLALFKLTSHTRPQNLPTAPQQHPHIKPPASSLNSNLNLNMHENSKPEGKPEHQKPENDTAGCLESFFGVFKNLFGCIKNAEEAYSHAPSQFKDQIQQIQPPQQVSSTFSKIC